jgi:hypothetical protein
LDASGDFFSVQLSSTAFRAMDLLLFRAGRGQP